MELIDNKEVIRQVLREWESIQGCLAQPLVREPFLKDFVYRFCWNSNSIEGNTLSLDETVSLIEYDEVRSGHTYAEYTEAKYLYRAIREMLRLEETEITEEWIKETNGLILGVGGQYRKNNLYIGTLLEAIYYPPDHSEVPGMMGRFVKGIQGTGKKDTDAALTFGGIAEAHVRFEQIHPFRDGNGRTGRMLMNQMLINAGWLPVIMESQSKYRQSFRRYDSAGDISLLVHLICKGELSAIKRVKTLQEKVRQSMEPARRESGPKL